MSVEIVERDPVHVVESDLATEFHGRLTHEVIVSLAREEVAALDSAVVRSFVPVLAWRRARQRAQRLLLAD